MLGNIVSNATSKLAYLLVNAHIIRQWTLQYFFRPSLCQCRRLCVSRFNDLGTFSSHFHVPQTQINQVFSGRWSSHQGHNLQDLHTIKLNHAVVIFFSELLPSLQLELLLSHLQFRYGLFCV